jgi:hypothetical protein
MMSDIQYSWFNKTVGSHKTFPLITQSPNHPITLP